MSSIFLLVGLPFKRSSNKYFGFSDLCKPASADCLVEFIEAVKDRVAGILTTASLGHFVN